MSNMYQNPYGSQWNDPNLAYQSAPRPRGQNKWGVVSLVIGILVVLIEGVCTIMAAVLVSQGHGEQSPTMMVAGCSILLGLLLALVGVALGIVGACQRMQSKALSIVGICINAVVLLGMGCLMLIGMVSK